MIGNKSKPMTCFYTYLGCTPNSYSSSYRTAVTEILKLLNFKSNNHLHQPVIEAIELLRSYDGSKQITIFTA
jgi:hypothetical protein